MNEERLRIGAKVKELRERKGLSTRQLADLCGVNFSNIGKIERGTYNASVDVLSKVLVVLESKVDITPLNS